MSDRTKRLCSAIELAKLLVLLIACGTLASCNANRASAVSSDRKPQEAAVLTVPLSGGRAEATAGGGNSAAISTPATDSVSSALETSASASDPGSGSAETLSSAAAPRERGSPARF